jgi:nicotinamide mononucleotide (NMN) deamidase PncC
MRAVRQFLTMWLCCTSEEETKRASIRSSKGGYPMKKVLIAVVATLVAISVSGCAGGLGKGKGKAPPPVVTKG